MESAAAAAGNGMPADLSAVLLGGNKLVEVSYREVKPETDNCLAEEPDCVLPDTPATVPNHSLDPAAEVIDFTKLHSPSVALSAPPISAPLQPKPGPTGLVALQHEYQRWQIVKHDLGITLDHQLATVLLDMFQNTSKDAQNGMDDTDCDGGMMDIDASAHVKVKIEADPTWPPPRAAKSKAQSSDQWACSVRDERRPGPGRPPKNSPSSSERRRRCPPRRLPPGPLVKPCPRSKKPPALREPVVYHDSSGSDHEEPEPAAASGGSDDEADPADAQRGYSFPPVDPDLLQYFSCGMCDNAGYTSVGEHFDHLWEEHTQFHMVGGRIQRIPIRLRAQLFVVCALCGLNNRGSASDQTHQLTKSHLPKHAALLARAAAAPLQCDECDEKFATRGLLAMHTLDTEHQNDAHRCSSCQLLIEGSRNYLCHLQRHYLSRVFQCYFCMALFAEETQCIAHVKRHHAADIAVHKCSQCNYATALFHDFLLHIRGHSQLTRHICHVCGARFVSKMSLKHHIPTHTASQFPCEQCDRVFNHPQTLRRHVINQHVNAPEKCTCSVCGRQFGTAFSMRRHYMIHTGERPHQCEKCGHGFVQKGDLASHRKRCSGRVHVSSKQSESSSAAAGGPAAFPLADAGAGVGHYGTLSGGVLAPPGYLSAPEHVAAAAALMSHHTAGQRLPLPSSGASQRLPF